MNGAYIKFILTAIAIGLFWIAANGTIRAAAGPDVIKVNIEQIEGQSLRYSNSLPVVVKK